MSRALPLKDISESIKKGIAKAHSQFYKGTQEWLWKAPEYFLTVYVYNELLKILNGETIRLEAKVRELLEQSGGIGKGKVDKRLERGRVDIVIDYINSKKETPLPRGIIELKNQVYNISKIKPDLDRIHKLFHRINNQDAKHSLQFGICCYYVAYTENHKEPKIAKNVKSLKEQLKIYEAKSNDISIHVEYEPHMLNDSSWGIVIVQVIRKK